MPQLPRPSVRIDYYGRLTVVLSTFTRRAINITIDGSTIRRLQYTNVIALTQLSTDTTQCPVSTHPAPPQAPVRTRCAKAARMLWIKMRHYYAESQSFISFLNASSKPSPQCSLLRSALPSRCVLQRGGVYMFFRQVDVPAGRRGSSPGEGEGTPYGGLRRETRKQPKLQRGTTGLTESLNHG